MSQRHANQALALLIALLGAPFGLLVASPPALAAEDGPHQAPPPPSDTSKAPANPDPDASDSSADKDASSRSRAASQEPADAAGFARRPGVGRGAVWGVVSDSAYHESAVEARVSALGTGVATLTDEEGRFRLELAPGTYSLVFAYDGHHDKTLPGVVVTAGGIVRVDAELEPDAASMDVIVVETDADQTSVEGQLLVRKRSANVGDAVGAKEMTRNGSSNAAQAASRLVGANVVGGRFVFVRGLGQRYTNALLNGAPLPSPEPDQATVPLDLFPAGALDSLTIVKTFTPDLPANFAGGTLQLRTKTLPKDLLLELSLGGSYNTAATFRDRLAYPGSRTDWLGIDSGARQLPSGLPAYKLIRLGSRGDGSRVQGDELEHWGQRLNSPMSTTTAFTPPNGTGALTVGKTFSLGGERKLGTLAALSYGRHFEVRRGERLRTYGLDGGTGNLRLLNDVSAESGTEKIRWGAFGSATVDFNPRNTLELVALRSHSSEDMAREAEGFYEDRQGIVHSTELRFVSRTLDFVALRGEHGLGALELAWTLSLSGAEREEPDRRTAVFTLGNAGYSFKDGTDSGQHFFAAQSEATKGGSLDITHVLREGPTGLKLKWGGMVSLKDREFDARRFAFRDKTGSADASQMLCPTTAWDPACPEHVFTRENIQSGALRLEESTRENDAFTATQQVYAGYVMTDAQLSESLRAILGIRYEHTDQRLRSFDPYAPETTPVESQQDSGDPLPAAALVLTPSAWFNARLSYGKTLARPELRELAPFAFTDYFGSRPIQGNPDLSLTTIHNYDLRVEVFPSAKEVVALGLFYKHFDAPVERIIKAAAQDGIVTYMNAEAADLWGAELEAREALPAPFERLQAVANLTLARSSVTLGREETSFMTTRERALANQAPFIVNAALDYEDPDLGLSARATYGISGKTITDVGTEGLPDVYAQPHSELGLVVSKRLGEHFTLKATASNILDSPIVSTQGPEHTDGNVVRQYTTGADYGLTLSCAY